MKNLVMLATLFLGCLTLMAQQGPPAGAPGPGPRGAKMQGMKDMCPMHGPMMTDMQSDLDSMKAALKQMQDSLDKVSDPATRQQLQWNNEMWQKMVDNMEKHMAMMKHMMADHPMMMHHGAGMKGMAPPPPAKQK